MARKSKDGLKRKSSSDSITDNESIEFVLDDNIIKDENIIEETIIVSDSITETEGVKSPNSSKLSSPSSSSKKSNNEDKHIDLDSWLNEKDSSFVNLTYPNPSCIFFTRTVIESICNGSMTEKEIRQSVTDICNDIGVKSTGRGTVAGLSLEVSTICGILNGIGIFEVDDKNHSIIHTRPELSQYRSTSILSKFLWKYLSNNETNKLTSNISDLPLIKNNEMILDEYNINNTLSNINSNFKLIDSIIDNNTNTDINIENNASINIENNASINSNTDNIIRSNNIDNMNNNDESTEMDDGTMDIGSGVNISPSSIKQENIINSTLFDNSDSSIPSSFSSSIAVENMTNSDSIIKFKREDQEIETRTCKESNSSDSENDGTNKEYSNRILAGSEFVENEVRFFQTGIGGDLLRSITNDWKYQLPKYFDDSKRSFKKHKAALAAKALNATNNPSNRENNNHIMMLDANGLIVSKPPVKRTKIVYNEDGVAVIKTITSRRKKGEAKKIKELQKLALQNGISNALYASLQPIVSSSTEIINVANISDSLIPEHTLNSIATTNPIVELSNVSNEIQSTNDTSLIVPDNNTIVDNNIFSESLQVESDLSSNIIQNIDIEKVGVGENNSLQINTNLPIDEEDSGNDDSDNNNDDDDDGSDDGSDDEKDELDDELDDDNDDNDNDDDDDDNNNDDNNNDEEDDEIEMDDDNNDIVNKNNDSNNFLDDSENINNCYIDNNIIKSENNTYLIDQIIFNNDTLKGITNMEENIDTKIKKLDNGMEIIDVKETNENSSIANSIVANMANNSSLPLPNLASTLNLPLNFNPQSIELSNMLKLGKNQNIKLLSERRRRASNQRAWRLEEDVVKFLLTDPVILLTNWGKACYDESNSQELEENLLRKIASQCGIQMPIESFRQGTRYLVEDNSGKQAVPSQINIVKKEFSQSKPLRDGGILTAASLIQRANKKLKKQVNSSFGYHTGVMCNTAPKIAPPLHLYQETYELISPIIEDSLYASNAFPVSNKAPGPITVTNVMPDLCIRTSEIPWKMVANEFILLNADDLDSLLPQSPRDPTPHSTRTRSPRALSIADNPLPTRNDSNDSNKIRKRRFSDLDLSSSLTPSTSNRVIGTGSNGGYGVGLGLGLKKSTSFEISAPQYKVVTKMTKNIYEEILANGGEDSGEEEDLSDEAVLQRHEDVLKDMRDKWASLVKLKKEMRELNNSSSSNNSVLSLASTTSLPHFAQMKVNAEAAANGLSPNSANHSLINIKSRRRNKSKSKRGRPPKIISRVYSNDSHDIIQDNTEEMDGIDNDDNEEEMDGEIEFKKEIDVNDDNGDDDNNRVKKNSNSSNSIANNSPIIAPTTKLSLSSTKLLSFSNNQEQLKRINLNNSMKSNSSNGSLKSPINSDKDTKIRNPFVLSPEIVNNSEIEAIVATRSSPRSSKLALPTSDSSLSSTQPASNGRDTRKRNRDEVVQVQEQVVVKSRYFREKEAREAREKSLPDNLRESPRVRAQRAKSP